MRLRGTVSARWRRLTLYGLVSGALALAMRVVCRWDVPASSRLPDGGVIVAPNHLSVLDPLLVAFAVLAAGRTPRFVGTAGVFETPIVGGILRFFGHLPLSRGAGADPAQLTRIASALRAGECVVMYPEGRITTSADLSPGRGRPGVARLAAKTGAPVVALGHWGSQDLWHRGHSSLRRWPPRRARTRFRFGPPVLVPAGTDLPGCVSATERLMAQIRTLADQARTQPASSPTELVAD